MYEYILMMEIMEIEVTVMSTKSHMVKYLLYMSAPLFTPGRITSDITTNIAKVHTESTATITRRVVTISRYLNGFLIAMYLSTVINTR